MAVAVEHILSLFLMVLAVGAALFGARTVARRRQDVIAARSGRPAIQVGRQRKAGWELARPAIAGGDGGVAGIWIREAVAQVLAPVGEV